jgi:hypothetical protein
MQKNKELYYYAEVVHRWTGVTLRQIQSRDRHADYVTARHCLMYILRFRAKLTLEEIGRLLRRHHSTVYHAIGVIEDYQRITKQYLWLDKVRPFKNHNVMPLKSAYLCTQCGCEVNNNPPVHLRQAAADCAPAGYA